jgi:hypothetical protein
MYDSLSLSVLHRINLMANAEQYLPALDANAAHAPTQQLRQHLAEVQMAGRLCSHFYVEKSFRDLVQFAAADAPADLVFDQTALIEASGWAEIEGGLLPYLNAPETERMDLLYWFRYPSDLLGGQSRYKNSWLFRFMHSTAPVWDDQQEFADKHGFMWANFALNDGDALSHAVGDPALKGWGPVALTLLHLLGQRLAAMPRRSVRANVQSQAEAYKMNMNPRIVTLRRLLYEKTEAENSGREYQCQWHVRGHWRQQFYHSTGEHHPVFIDAYIKGPEDKPLKPLTHSIFVARR